MKNDSSMRHLPSAGPQQWPETIWPLVQKAREGDGPSKKLAVEQLITVYYKPVFRFFQRALGIHGDRLNDVTQEFFTRFVEKDFLKNLAQEKSFRGFLKVAARRHYINWCEAEQVRRPKDGRKLQGLHDEEGRNIDIPLTEAKFGELIDEELRGWYLEEALERVRAKLRADGKDAYLKVFEGRVRFDGEKPTDYETLAKQVGVRIMDVRNYLTAARKIFREALLDLAAGRSDHAETELRELGLYTLIS